ncbi:MAG: glycosyltransferase family 2 protein, partial [Acidimicrobiales bacterium]
LEDTDLCRKLHMGGWRIRWQPAAHIIHLWGRSVSDPVARQRLFFSAQDRYFRRWHRPVSLAVLRMLRAPLLLRTRLQRRRADAGRQPDGVDRS